MALFLRITDPDERRFNPGGKKVWAQVMNQSGGFIEAPAGQVLDIEIRPNGKIHIRLDRGTFRVDADTQLAWVDIQAGAF